MTDKLKVVLAWHMHQPEYRDRVRDEFRLPWTYLHAIKDYVDMVGHLEAVPSARAVVNFAPTLLEQIGDYTRQLEAHLREGAPIRDKVLAGLTAECFTEDADERLALMESYLRANEGRMIGRFPAYQALANMVHDVRATPDNAIYLSDQFLADLATWYHLAWLGETVRRTDPRVKDLMDQGKQFTPAQRRGLMELLSQLLSGVIGRYRRLAEAGRIELSMTPYAHPIVPLLIDFETARESLPDAPLPELDQYPDGRERAEWHIEKGLEVFEQFFGFRPQGCWPSEGGVSAATVDLASSHGFRWVATGESVFRNSQKHCQAGDEVHGQDALYRPYRLQPGGTACFFRSDSLSDLIGFTFADWHADDAVGHLINQLDEISKACDSPGERVVSIVLDGENAWEYYPENAFHFLTALYQRLAKHPALEMTTFSACLDAGIQTPILPAMTSGSWVYGTFSTWIGDTDKNRAWDMLGDAEKAVREAVKEGRLDDQQLEIAYRQLAVCEGSDWFWWFGDYNPAESVRDFDALYRLHLSNLYTAIGTSPPDYLQQAFSLGKGAATAEAGGVMRRGAEN